MQKPTLLLTRPAQDADRFAREVTAVLRERVDICVSPLLEIEGVAGDVTLEADASAIFTSRNGVRFAMDGQDRPAFCVGARTAEAARDRGWRVDVVEENAEALIVAMGARPPTGAIVHFAGRHRRGDIAGHLRDMGMRVEVVTLYDQRLVPLSAAAREVLRGEGRVIVPLFSPRTATQFAAERDDWRRVTIVAMSDAVARMIPAQEGVEVQIIAHPTALEMHRHVEMLLREDSLA